VRRRSSPRATRCAPATSRSRNGPTRSCGRCARVLGADAYRPAPRPRGPRTRPREAPELPIALFGLYAAVANELGILTGARRRHHRRCRECVGGLRDACRFDRRARVPRWRADEWWRTESWRRRGYGTSARERALLPLSTAMRVFSTATASGLVGSDRSHEGCNHRCRHCPVPLVLRRPLAPNPARAGVWTASTSSSSSVRSTSTFADADFLNRPQHSLRVRAPAARAYPDVSFDATIKVSHLLPPPRRGARARGRSGFCFVVSAFESTSDVVLARLDKGHRGRGPADRGRGATGRGVEPRTVAPALHAAGRRGATCSTSRLRPPPLISSRTFGPGAVRHSPPPPSRFRCSSPPTHAACFRVVRFSVAMTRAQLGYLPWRNRSDSGFSTELAACDLAAARRARGGCNRESDRGDPDPAVIRAQCYARC